MCQVSLGRPLSMGRILVNSSDDPSLEDIGRPVVDYNLFSDETDYDVLVEGTSWIQSCWITQKG